MEVIKRSFVSVDRPHPPPHPKKPRTSEEVSQFHAKLSKLQLSSKPVTTNLAAVVCNNLIQGTGEHHLQPHSQPNADPRRHSDKYLISHGSGSSTNLASPFPGSGPISYSQPSCLGSSTNAVFRSSRIFGQQPFHPSLPPAHLPQSYPLPSYSQMQIPGHFITTPPHALTARDPSSFSRNRNLQPPPPSQSPQYSARLVTPSSLPIPKSQDNPFTPPSTRTMLPPLPPGPTPSSQNSNTSSVGLNPISSLLMSLVAKGIISSPASDMPASTSTQVPNEVSMHRTELSSSKPMLVPSTLGISNVPPPSKQEPSVSLIASSVADLEELIGIDFKPEVVRKLQSLVVSSLFDDLKFQCGRCGLRFKLQEQLHSHSDVHASKNSEQSTSDKVSSNWYSNKNSWVAGNKELLLVPRLTTTSSQVDPFNDKCEPMVPADESQCICALCGEGFEDFYCHERDEWMYKGSVYLNSSKEEGDMGSMDEDTVQQDLIVHFKCMSSLADDKNVPEEHMIVCPCTSEYVAC